MNKPEMWAEAHCNDPDNLNFKGRVMVLDPTLLKPEVQHPDKQLVLCREGFGCSPTAIGTKVYGTLLHEGADYQFYRHEFIGELKEEHHPQWLQQKLEEMEQTTQEQTQTMELH